MITYYTTRTVTRPISKINQSKCSIAGPIFSMYWIGHCPEWSGTCKCLRILCFLQSCNKLSYQPCLLGTVLGEYRPPVIFVRTSLCSVRTVKTSGRGEFLGCFYFHFSLVFHDFERFFQKTIIPLELVGYEVIIANSALRSSLAIYHLISNARSWNNWLLLFSHASERSGILNPWIWLANCARSSGPDFPIRTRRI